MGPVTTPAPFRSLLPFGGFHTYFPPIPSIESSPQPASVGLPALPIPSFDCVKHLAVKLLFEEATKVLQNKLQSGRPQSTEMEIERCHTLEFQQWFKFKILLIKRHDIYATKKKAVIANAMSSIDISIPSFEMCNYR
ncbi:hypothetical protein Taro_027880 [Colocasia esculenta]|uniref:Uncharacterized protein n=1 Tax=Colocasia esculenta TaxID=4460 RepID=A0A843VGZ3_COLES|nr:hypothetical protein [Colocasia esculenta]